MFRQTELKGQFKFCAPIKTENATHYLKGGIRINSCSRCVNFLRILHKHSVFFSGINSVNFSCTNLSSKYQRGFRYGLFFYNYSRMFSKLNGLLNHEKIDNRITSTNMF